MTLPLHHEEDKAAVQRLNSLPGVAFSRELDHHRTLSYLSQSCLSLTGYAAHELLPPAPLSFNDLIVPEDLGELLVRIDEALHTQQPYSAEYRLQTRSGEQRWFLEQGYIDAEDADAPNSIQGLMTDISMQKQLQTQLQRDAFYDKLTGLPNRSLFLDRLAQAVRRLGRSADYQFAVLFLDLDRFKVINDSLGHRAGDILLIQVAARLGSCVRPGDTVARLGGDEFTMLIDAVRSLADVTQVADRILQDMGTLFQVEEYEIFTTTSIGIALSTADYINAEDLIRDADIALYQAKAMGKACYALFQPGMHIHAVARLQLEHDLRHALLHQEFCLLYQPIVAMETGLAVGFEALVYWQHPRRGLLGPGEFLPVAQEAGLMVSIGHWVLETACTQMALWQRQFEQSQSMFISVNLAGVELAHPDLIAVVEGVLMRSGLMPSALKLEMSEATLMNAAGTVPLNRLRAQGVQLCIDDFGTGFSVLGDLENSPVDCLKVDRSFMARLESEEQVEVVRTILALARGLGFPAVAVALESPEQVAMLRALRCEYGQGFAWSRPMLAPGMLPWLERRGEEEPQQSSFTGSPRTQEEVTALLPGSLPRLLIRAVAGRYQFLLVGRMSWSVGRALDCSIFVADRLVSREHAMLLRLPFSNDFFWVDLGSRNGSFINYQRVTKPMLLQDGDLIRVGKMEMQFVTMADTRSVPRTMPTVLMHQPALMQGQLWREMLMAQQVSIIWQANDVPLLYTLRQLAAAGEGFPQLLLLDVMTIRMDLSAFFEELALAFTPMPVVLTMAQDTEALLKPQALRAGALEVLGDFQLTGGVDMALYATLVARHVGVVLRALEMPVEEGALVPVAQAALVAVLRNQTLF